jgi:hypothetical protein
MLYLTVLWGGNGLGKSMILAEIARRALRGQLAWQTPGQPYTVIIAGNTWTQIGETLRYLWDGIQPGEFKKGIRFEGGRVQGQRLAVFDFYVDGKRCGQLRCGTFRAANLAGPRADVVLSDEPLPEDVHSELMPRLIGRNGRMYVTFTPTLGTASNIDYLWRIIDDPGITWAGEIQAPTTIENCTPRGGLIEVPFIRQVEIDRLREGVSAIQADMRMGLSRYPRLDTSYFDGAWDPRVCRTKYSPPKGTSVIVSMDHGSKAQAQVISLTYAEGRGLSTHYHVADMHMSTGRSETRQDARGLLDMLIRAKVAHPRPGKVPNLDLSDVDLWIGDRSHGGYRGGLGAKSNGDLQRAIAAELGFDVDRMQAHVWRMQLPEPLRKIRQPRKRFRSMWDGMETLRRMMPQRLTVSDDPRMDPMADAFDRWAGALLDPLRDRLDSVRYGVEEVDSGRWKMVG